MTMAQTRKIAPAGKRQAVKTTRKYHTVRDAAIGWGPAGDQKGRGVFARRDIKKGEVLEIAPVIPMASKAVMPGETPDGYLLMWQDDVKGQEHALVLGYVMLYNHSDTPNIGMTSDFDAQTITVTALRPIKCGEELAWDYSCEIWF
jgi:SET domain-containing protein